MARGKKTGGRDFKSGNSANPGGRPKELVTVRDLARAHTAEAIATLVEIMQATDGQAAPRVTASQALLDRGWGKPAQPVDGDGEGGPIKSRVTFALEFGSDG